MTANACKLDSGRALLRIAAGIVLCLLGCRSPSRAQVSGVVPKLNSSELLELQYDTTPAKLVSFESAAPRTTRSDRPTEFWDLTLDEAIRMALTDTEVLRSLGATVVTSPQIASGAFDPAIQSTNPNYGIEAALAQFDTQVSSSLLVNKNNDVFNNPVLGGGAAQVRDDVVTGTLGLRKINAFGTQFSVKNNLQNSVSDNPSLLFPSSWVGSWEGTIRQPLMQGRGVQFNQIAGPTTQPGFRFSNGVLLSKVNHEVSIAQFEKSVRNMVREVAETYWQLDLAYKRLQASENVRDQGLATWKSTQARFDNGLTGGGADQEALARAQYYQLESQVTADIGGNESSGQPGILQAEANLRRLLGLPQSDDRLIRPQDQPFTAPVTYDWKSLVNRATNSRVEIREQLWRVKQRELELIASRNFLLPRLDLIATYRNNGFGDRLAGGTGPFSSALNDAFKNDRSEMEVGVAYDFPVGYRQAYAAVRNSTLSLCREKAVLEEQKEQILFQLGNAVRALYKSQYDLELQSNRLTASRSAVAARQASYEADTATIDQLLEAQVRMLEAERAYFDTLLAVQRSFIQLNFEAGLLLSNYDIQLSEACE